jgi:hypothetical protein
MSGGGHGRRECGVRGPAAREAVAGIVLRDPKDLLIMSNERLEELGEQYLRSDRKVPFHQFAADQIVAEQMAVVVMKRKAKKGV